MLYREQDGSQELHAPPAAAGLAIDHLAGLDTIMRGLVSHPEIGYALVAAPGAAHTTNVLACGSAGGSAHTGPGDFVSRAVWCGQPLAEPIDRAYDGSLDDPMSGFAARFAISAPILLPDEATAALCVGLPSREGQPDPRLLELVEGYARLVRLVLLEQHHVTPDPSGHDERTGCFTHAALVEIIDAEITRCSQEGLDMTCCVIGPARTTRTGRGRRFTPALDPGRVWLHEVMGRALVDLVGAGDSVGLYGREGFAIVMPATDRESGLRIAEGIRRSICELRPPGEIDVRVGLAQWTPGTTRGRLLANADEALRIARTRWRDRVTAV